MGVRPLGRAPAAWELAVAVPQISALRSAAGATLVALPTLRISEPAPTFLRDPLPRLRRVLPRLRETPSPGSAGYSPDSARPPPPGFAGYSPDSAGESMRPAISMF